MISIPRKRINNVLKVADKCNTAKHKKYQCKIFCYMLTYFFYIASAKQEKDTGATQCNSDKSEIKAVGTQHFLRINIEKGITCV